MEIHDWILLVSSLGAILGVLIGGGGIAAYFRVRDENQKLQAEVLKIRAEANQTDTQSDADAAIKIGNAWSALVTPLNTEIASLRAENIELKSQIKSRDDRIRDLEKKVAEFTGILLGLGVKIDGGALKPVPQEGGAN